MQRYSELEYFEMENKMRRVLQAILEPVVQQSNIDRRELSGLEERLSAYTSKVQQMEDILYQKDDLERMALFDKIFKSIKTVDKNHLAESEKLRSEQVKLEGRISQLEFLDRAKQVRFDGQDDLVE
jgi:hypothetical protein